MMVLLAEDAGHCIGPNISVKLRLKPISYKFMVMHLSV
jgi:hypothetical protein